MLDEVKFCFLKSFFKKSWNFFFNCFAKKKFTALQETNWALFVYSRGVFVVYSFFALIVLANLLIGEKTLFLLFGSMKKKSVHKKTFFFFNNFFFECRSLRNKKKSFAHYFCFNMRNKTGHCHFSKIFSSSLKVAFFENEPKYQIP